MKWAPFIFIALCITALCGCSDLLADKELQAELKKSQNNIQCGPHITSDMPDSCKPIFVIDGKVLPIGGGSPEIRSLNPENISSLDVITDSAKVPIKIRKSKIYRKADGYSGIVLITTKGKAKQ